MHILQKAQFQPALNAAREITSWWLSELLDLMPEVISKAVFRLEPDVSVTLRSGAVIIAFKEDGAAADEVSLKIDQPDSAAACFASLSVLLAERLKNARRVALKVDASLALKKRIWLPLAAERNLQGAVHYQIERQFPFRLEHVDIACGTVERDLEGGQLGVDVYVIERSTLAPWLDELMEKTAAGLSVAIDDAAVDEPVPLRLPAGRTKGSGGRGGRAIQGLYVLAGLLVMVAASQFYDMRERRADYLQSEIEALRPLAQTAAAARSRAQGRRDTLALLRQALERPSAADFLEGLSLRLPDGGWLTTLNMNGAAGSAHGFADNASSLPGLIDASPLFDETQLRAAVQPIPEEGVERFELSFVLERGGN